MSHGPSGLCRHVWVCRTCGTHRSDWEKPDQLDAANAEIELLRDEWHSMPIQYQMAVDRLARERDEFMDLYQDAQRRRVEHEDTIGKLSARIAELERDAARFRNGFANLTQALQDAPGLPIETLSAEDQAKWTDLLTGLLMALGVLEATGKPQSMWEALTEAAMKAKP